MFIPVAFADGSRSSAPFVLPQAQHAQDAELLAPIAMSIRKVWKILLIANLASVLLLVQAQAAEFFVATNGSEGWSGRLPAPNAEGTDGPVATLLRARNALRELKASGGLNEPVTVQVRDGRYFLADPLVLRQEDSGAADYPISYTAYPGERPILSGGRSVTGWKPFKEKILQTDLPGAKGGKWKPRQLFLNGELQTRARYPNFNPEDPLYSGWLFTEAADEENPSSAFVYKPGSFSKRWTKPTEGEINIFFGYGWCNSIIPIKSVDEDRRVISLTRRTMHFERPPWHMGWIAYRPGNRFFVENLLEELGQPGEWCLDSEDGKLYFWPPSGSLGPDDQVVVPALDCLVALHGASWVNISGLTFTETADGDECFRAGGEGYGPLFPQQGLKYCGEALHLNGAEHCRVENNTFDSVGGNAIYLEGHNARNVIRRNEIANAGANGIVLLGDRDVHPIFNQVEDNRIYRCGRMKRWGTGIFLGVSDGNVVTHNYIHHVPFHAIDLGTNGHGRNIVEHNEIRHTAQETCDTGAINSWGDVPGMLIQKESERSGHIIRYNLIVDTMGCCVWDDGKFNVPERNGTMAIYLDDCTSNCFVYGNIIVRAGLGVHCHNGRHNVIENNIFVDCKWAQLYADGMSVRLGVSHMAGFMKGNRFYRNIVYSTESTPFMFRLDMGWTDRSIAQSDYNLVSGGVGDAPLIEARVSNKMLSLSDWQKMGYDGHSVIADPLFVDPKNEDFRLQPGSPAFELGFQPIDLSKIGIRPKD